MRHKEFTQRLILIVATIASLIIIYRSRSISSTAHTSISETSILEFIKAHHLIPPSKKHYNLSTLGSHENFYSSLVNRMLGNTTTGVFIEAGAFDGEEESNSLPLELLGWKGILVECNPHVLPKLKSKNRKAWIADVCLSTSHKSGSVKLYSSPDWPASAQINRQQTLDEMKAHGIDFIRNKTWTEYERRSFPLHSIIEAVGEFKQIDFLSLDVQGAEIGILYNYPFEKIPIKVIIAEVSLFHAKQQKFFRKFLEGKGYKLYYADDVDYAFIWK